MFVCDFVKTKFLNWIKKIKRRPYCYYCGHNHHSNGEECGHDYGRAKHSLSNEILSLGQCHCITIPWEGSEIQKTNIAMGGDGQPPPSGKWGFGPR